MTIDDTIVAKVTVIKKNKRKPIVYLNCECINQHGKKVITGIAKVLAPTEKVKRKRVILPKIVIN